MTRAGTKTTMKRQPVKTTKMDKVYKDVQKFTKDKKVADELIAKYGVDCAYAIVRQCMQEPANVVKRINSNSTIWKTGDAIKYFAQSTLTDQQVATGIKKTKVFVQTSRNSKNKTPQAKTSQAKVIVKTEQRTANQKIVAKGNTPIQQSNYNQKLPKLNMESSVPSMKDFRTPAFKKTASKPEQPSIEKSDKQSFTIEELMKNNGVSSADIQAVLGKNKEYLSKLQPGKTNKDLARRANNVTGQCSGGCLAGVQKMYPGLSGSNPNWPKKEYNSRANSACNAHTVLEKGGKFVTVEVKNLAYGKSAGSIEEKQMQKFNRTLPAGTIASLDNKKPDELQGRRTPNNSEKHGHIWVQDSKGQACSDGRQAEGPSFSRYGKDMFISVAVDCSVPRDIALELVKEAKARQNREQQLAIAQNRGYMNR